MNSSNAQTKEAMSHGHNSQRYARHISFLFCIFLLALIFHFHGNTLFTKEYGASFFRWIFAGWTTNAPGVIDSSHGPLILVATLVMLWHKRRDLALAEKHIYTPALLLIIVGLFFHWTGLIGQQNLPSALGLIILLWTLPLYIYGSKVGRLTLFPCAYLMFAVPLDFFGNISFKLRLSASTMAEYLLKGIAIPIQRKGTGLILGKTHHLLLDVADPCSGLHSLTALCALTTIYAYFITLPKREKLILVLLAIPIAYISNIIRIVFLAMVANWGNKTTALNLYHDSSGYIVFLAGVLLSVGAGTILQSYYDKKVKIIDKKTSNEAR